MTAPTLLARQLRQIGKNFIAWQRTRAQSWNMALENPRNRLIVLGGAAIVIVGGVLAALRFAPTLDHFNVESRTVVEELPAPDLGKAANEARLAETPLSRTHFVRPGETMLAVASDLGITDPAAFKAIKTDPVLRPMLFMQPGQFIHAEVYPDGRLENLRLYSEGPHRIDSSVTELSRTPEGAFKSSKTPFAYQRELVYVEGAFQGTWWKTARRYDIPDEVLADIPEVWDTPDSPTTRLKTGSRFSIVWAKRYADKTFIRNSRLLGIAIERDGRLHEAFWYETKPGKGSYYTPTGESASQTFIRIPLDVKDVSSEFAALRRHPITGELRPHNGTDFRAPSGSRIFAAADGRITTRAYNKNGYGNYITIDHGRGRETVYAHMSRFAKGVRAGMRVKKGQLIGYVGMTGLATGPHLHYELKIDGIQINPRTADLPDTENLSAFQLARFKQLTSEAREHFDAVFGRVADEEKPEADEGGAEDEAAEAGEAAAKDAKDAKDTKDGKDAGKTTAKR